MIWPFSKNKQPDVTPVDVLEHFYADHACALFDALAQCAKFGKLQRLILAFEVDIFSYFITDLSLSVTEQHDEFRKPLHRRIITEMGGKYQEIVPSGDTVEQVLRNRVEKYESIIDPFPNILDALPSCAKALCDYYSAENLAMLMAGQRPSDSERGGIFTRIGLTAEATDFSQYYTTIRCLALTNVLGRFSVADLNDGAAFQRHLKSEIDKLDQFAKESEQE